MRGVSRAIDKFCQKHRRFGIPRLMIYIVFISAIVFIFGNELIHRLHFSPVLILRGEVWRLITWVFVPLNNQFFFYAITLLFYYFIGSTLEREWGTAKFTIFYIFGIILHIIYGFAMWLITGFNVLIEPIYLNLSMFFAFAVLFPDHVVRLFFIIPVKIKWLALLNAVFFLFTIVRELLNGRIFVAVLPLVAILNFILICGGDALEYLRPLRARASPSAIDFKRAARKVKKEQASKEYRHKCAVCGKTDAQYPNLEFRYCSRCAGYHCYCQDHINNHEHFL